MDFDSRNMPWMKFLYNRLFLLVLICLQVYKDFLTVCDQLAVLFVTMFTSCHILIYDYMIDFYQL